jgi:hypothetical protein
VRPQVEFKPQYPKRERERERERELPDSACREYIKKLRTTNTNQRAN